MMASMGAPLWTPSAERIAAANITRFRERLRDRGIVDAANYQALYRWSLSAPETFWIAR